MTNNNLVLVSGANGHLGNLGMNAKSLSRIRRKIIK